LYTGIAIVRCSWTYGGFTVNITNIARVHAAVLSHRRKANIVFVWLP
jgi:hypothetical protein